MVQAPRRDGAGNTMQSVEVPGCQHHAYMHMWFSSACCAGGEGFFLGVGADGGQIVQPVCIAGLQPYKQMGPRSRKAEETRNVPMCVQHAPG